MTHCANLPDGLDPASSASGDASQTARAALRNEQSLHAAQDVEIFEA